MMSSKSELSLLTLSRQVLTNVFIDKQKRNLLFSLQMVDICPWKNCKEDIPTFLAFLWSQISFIFDYMEVSQESYRKQFSRVSHSPQTITMSWVFIYIIWKAFFDISCVLGDACAVLIYITLSRSDRRFTWNVFKSIEIIQ